MIHIWLQKALIGLAASSLGIGLLFCYVMWPSPVARLGNHNQRQARLVQAGMAAARARQLMGPAQQWQLLPATGDTLYMYQAPPLSSDGVINMTVSPAGVVRSIGH